MVEAVTKQKTDKYSRWTSFHLQVRYQRHISRASCKEVKPSTRAAHLGNATLIDRLHSKRFGITASEAVKERRKEIEMLRLGTDSPANMRNFWTAVQQDLKGVTSHE